LNTLGTSYIIIITHRKNKLGKKKARKVFKLLQPGKAAFTKESFQFSLAKGERKNGKNGRWQFVQ